MADLSELRVDRLVNGSNNGPVVFPFGILGIATESVFAGYATSAGIATYTSEWNLGSNGTSDYSFTGPGFTSPTNDPDLYLVRGQQYKFTNTMGAHPFRIQSTPNGSVGTQYNDGIVNNDVSNGTLTWNVTFDAPDLLYYQCTAHPSMGGKIYILNAGGGGGGGGESYWASTSAGIHTLSNVGIGTTNPTDKLQVFGTFSLQPSFSTDYKTTISSGVRVENTNSSSSNPLAFSFKQAKNLSDFNFGSELGSLLYVDQSSSVRSRIGFVRDTTTGTGILLTTSGVSGNLTNGLIIRQSGNVGIGTTDPTSRLTVEGDVNVSGVVTATSFVGDGSGLTGVNASGGGGSGEFNTGISSSIQYTPLSYETDAFTFPSTAGKRYVIESINVSNVAIGDTEVNIIASITGSEQTYIAYNVPIVSGGAIELLKQPIVANPSDAIKVWATNYSYVGTSTGTQMYISYSEFDDTDYFVGYGATVSIATTSPTGIYTSTDSPSVLQSIHLTNRTDSGDYPVSVTITNGITTTYLVKDLILPRYSVVEILDRPKRIETDAVVGIEVRQTSTIDVIVSGKKITT